MYDLLVAVYEPPSDPSVSCQVRIILPTQYPSQADMSHVYLGGILVRYYMSFVTDEAYAGTFGSCFEGVCTRFGMVHLLQTTFQSRILTCPGSDKSRVEEGLELQNLQREIFASILETAPYVYSDSNPNIRP